MSSKKETIPIILVMTEGETERVYLDHLRVRGAGYELKVCRSSDRSAIGVVNDCTKRVKDIGLNLKGTDRAYCVFDVDRNTEAQLIKAKKLAEKNRIKVILSNPCYEIFYLYHFEKNIPPLDTPSDVKARLCRYIPDYKESHDYWDLLAHKQDVALSRIYGIELDDIPLNLSNRVAMTNLHILFDDLNNIKSG